jgi:hypothetical protein
MEDKLSFKYDAFIDFMHCNIDQLKIEIVKARNSINGLRKQLPRYPKDAENYKKEYERLEVLQLIAQLRSNQINKEVFDSKVEIEIKHLHD